MDAAEIHEQELTVGAAGRRMECGLEQVKSLRITIKGRLPLTDAESALDVDEGGHGIEDDLDGIEKKLKAALAILNTEIIRLETLWEQPA